MKELYPGILKNLKLNRSKENEEIVRIKNALYELKRARRNFDMVVGADNVELAILELNAAEKRYQNLLKEAKTKGIKRFSENDFNMELKAQNE